MDVAIRRLREKIEDEPASPRYIITKRGMGYYFAGRGVSYVPFTTQKTGADSGAADPPGGSFGPERKREGIGGEWHDEEKRKILSYQFCVGGRPVCGAAGADLFGVITGIITVF